MLTCCAPALRPSKRRAADLLEAHSDEAQEEAEAQQQGAAGEEEDDEPPGVPGPDQSSAGTGSELYVVLCVDCTTSCIVQKVASGILQRSERNVDLLH
jgi:hypothetical protein